MPLLLSSVISALRFSPRSNVRLCAVPDSPCPLPLNLLSGTNLDGKTLTRCYKASFDGWSALDFHRQVDELGSVCVVGLLKSGRLVGGYNPVGWESVDDYRATPRAFLFCSAAEAGGDSETGLTCEEWLQCSALGPGEIAVFDNARGGPQFGAADLIIGQPLAPGYADPNSMNDQRTAVDLRSVRSSLGGSYARLPTGNLPTGELVELEAYCNADLITRGDAWFAAQTDRASKAPELLVTGLKAAGRGDKSAATAKEEPAVGWWPW